MTQNYWGVGSMYKENQDEKMYREETTSVWHDITASKTEFRLSQQGVRMYIGAVMLINKGNISGTIYEYKPMFQLKYFDNRAESKSFAIFLNTANAQFLASSIRILTEDSSIVSFFSKSDTSGWYVKEKFRGVKVMNPIVFSKTSFVEIVPEVDERKLPSFKFKWVKDDKEISCIFTKGELLTLMSRLDGFINQCPMYVTIFENDILKSKLSCYTDQIAAVQNTVFALNDKFEKLLTEVKLNNKATQEHFSTVLTSILAVIAKTNGKVDTSTLLKEDIPTDCVDGTIDEEDGIILETSTVAEEFLEEVEDIVDTSKLPVIEDIEPESMHSTAQEQPNGYFNKPEVYINSKIEESMSQDSLTELFGRVEEPIQAQQDEPAVEKLSDFLEEKEEVPIWDIDNYAKYLQEKFKLEFTDNPEYVGGNRLMLDTLYPKDIQNVINEESETVPVCQTFLPEEKIEMMKNFDVDAVLTKLGGAINKEEKYTIAHRLIDTGMFTKAYVAGMLINKGRVGIPASSVLFATAVYATAYDLIAKGGDPHKIANECGMHILNCFIEAPKISEDKLTTYNKYFKALTKDLTGNESNSFDEGLFAIDKMLLRGVYEYSAFDMKLEGLTDEEKVHLVRALTDVYIMLYYAEKEHMLFNAQTSPNFTMFFLVNKHMYRFARALLVNILRCNEKVPNLKQGILFNMYDMKRFCERIGWAIEKYKDAVTTFFVTNDLVKKYVEPYVNDTPLNSLIPNTHVYRGLPCKEIEEAFSKKK